MKRTMLQVFAACIFMFPLTGIGAGLPVYNAISVPIPQSPTATLENIEKAVVRAGAKLGWKIHPEGPGKAEGIILLRTHVAYVNITYDTKAFSITYKDSVNLDYMPKENTIHKNYNGWIQNLEKAIVTETRGL